MSEDYRARQQAPVGRAPQAQLEVAVAAAVAAVMAAVLAAVVTAVLAAGVALRNA